MTAGGAVGEALASPAPATARGGTDAVSTRTWAGSDLAYQKSAPPTMSVPITTRPTSSRRSRLRNRSQTGSPANAAPREDDQQTATPQRRGAATGESPKSGGEGANGEAGRTGSEANRTPRRRQ